MKRDARPVPSDNPKIPEPMRITKDNNQASLTVKNPGQWKQNILDAANAFPGWNDHMISGPDMHENQHLFIWFCSEDEAKRAAHALREVFYSAPPVH